MKKRKRATRDQLCRKGDFWQEGMPLTQRDHELLQPLIDKANELGYTPLVSDVSSACRIKGRFRCWKDALKAAGLPSVKEPEQVKNVWRPKTTRCPFCPQSARENGGCAESRKAKKHTGRIPCVMER